uniref:Uncharacterized protein n=1 Tax=Rhabditophanes sp. KR3021 TaxID=114890 RepID=A0AC35U0U3_9BILA
MDDCLGGEVDPLDKYKCPRTDDFIKKTWPDLVGRTVSDCEDLAIEIIIDGFSMLLFRDANEYSVFEKAEQSRQIKLQAEMKRMQDEKEDKIKKEEKKNLRIAEREKRKAAKRAERTMQMEQCKLNNIEYVRKPPLTADQKVERKAKKAEERKKRREERRLGIQNNSKNDQSSNKKVAMSTSDLSTTQSSVLPTTSALTSDPKSMKSPLTNDGYSMLPSHNLKRPSSNSVDSGIATESPTAKVPKIEMDDNVKAHTNESTTRPSSSNLVNGHCRTPTSSLDLKNSHTKFPQPVQQMPLNKSSQGSSIQNQVPTSQDLALLELLKANPIQLNNLFNNPQAMYQLGISNIGAQQQNTAQQAQLLQLQQCLQLQQQNNMPSSSTGRVFNNPASMVPNQFGLPSQLNNAALLPNFTGLPNGLPASMAQFRNGLTEKKVAHFSDMHSKICLEISKIQGSSGNSSVTSARLTHNNRVMENKNGTNQTLPLPGITTGIPPVSANNQQQTSAPRQNGPSTSNTPNITQNNVNNVNNMSNVNIVNNNNGRDVAFQDMLMKHNQQPAKNVANQRPQSNMQMMNSSILNASPFPNINQLQTNEVAAMQQAIASALQNNGHFNNLQQQTSLNGLQQSNMIPPNLSLQTQMLLAQHQQQQQNQHAQLLLQNSLQSNGSASTNNIADTNQASLLLNANMQIQNQIDALNAQINALTNEITKQKQQLLNFQQLQVNSQSANEREHAHIESQKCAALVGDLSNKLNMCRNNLVQINGLVTPQDSNSINNQQQLQLQAQQLRNQFNAMQGLPQSNGTSTSQSDAILEIQRQRQIQLQQHMIRSMQSQGVTQQQQLNALQQQQQINQFQNNAGLSAMMQNPISSAQLLQLISANQMNNPVFKSPLNTAAAANMEQIQRQQQQRTLSASSDSQPAGRQ